MKTVDYIYHEYKENILYVLIFTSFAYFVSHADPDFPFWALIVVPIFSVVFGWYVNIFLLDHFEKREILHEEKHS